jgi:hypothetical protein
VRDGRAQRFQKGGEIENFVGFDQDGLKSIFLKIAHNGIIGISAGDNGLDLRI